MSATKIVSGSITNYLRLLTQIGVQLWTTPLILNGVGKDAYAIWALVFSVLSIVGLLEFGVGAGTVKYAAEARGSGDTDRRNRAVSTLFVMGWVCAVVALVAILGITAASTHLFSVPADLHATMHLVFLMLGLRYAVLLWPLSVFQGVLYGDAKIGTINIIQAGSTLLYGLGCWLAIRLGYGIVGVAGANLATMLIEYAAYWVVAKATTPGLIVRPSLFDRAILKDAWKLALSQLIVAASGLILLRTDPLIIQAFLPLAAVSVYAVALRISESAFLLVKQFINVLSPHIAERQGRGDHEGVRQMFVVSTRYALAPAFLIALPLAVYSTTILTHWIGPSVADGGPVLAVLCLSMLFMTPQVVASTFLTYTGRYLHASKPVVFGAILNVAASICFVKLFGLVGAALGTMAAVAVVDLFWIGTIARNALGVSIRQYAIEGFLPLVPASVLYLGVLMAFRNLMPPSSLGIIALECAVCAIVFVVAFSWTGLRPHDRARVMRRLRRSRNGSPLPNQP